ncbi:MAG: menaquinone biosynthesis protein [Thermodesulfovibrionales bacterium]|nr:menaquinone biosynthesis protein [Thermodesulfovibrionales bacterium]
MKRLRIGKISFLNILPIFKVLEGECYCPEYEYVEGYPTELNQMLRQGEIDISPSSSVEYLMDKESYHFLEGHSISARGPVRSILLFSSLPIERLGGHEITATHQSATSVSLLKIILAKFYGLDFRIKVTDTPIEEAIKKHSAYLAIGDEALKLSRTSLDIKTTSKEMPCKLQSINQQPFHVYDLSELWHRHTGLPMVFALWILKRETFKNREGEVEGFRATLDAARKKASERLREIASTPGLILPPEEAFSYWNDMIFDLPEDCMKGLELFGKYLKEI